jgi:class 3 adenylate cyclase
VLDLGGDPVAFGGDALTVVFDGPAEATAAAALRAASLLRDVARETAGTETSGRPVTLQTRSG